MLCALLCRFPVHMLHLVHKFCWCCKLQMKTFVKVGSSLQSVVQGKEVLTHVFFLEKWKFSLMLIVQSFVRYTPKNSSSTSFLKL